MHSGQKLFFVTCLTCHWTVFASAAVAQQPPLRWNLKAGETYLLQFDQQTTSEVAFAAKKATTRIDLKVDLAWTVTAADQQAMTIKQTVRRVQFKLISPTAGGFEYDSNQQSRPTGSAIEIAAAVSPLLKTVFELKLSPRGEVLEVVSSGTADVAAPKGSRDDKPASGSAPATALQRLLRQPLVVFPEDPVTAGDNWKSSSNLSAGGADLKQQTTWTYADTVERNGTKLERITTQSAIELPAARPPDSLKINEHQQSGTIFFSSGQGRLIEAEQTQRLVTEQPYRETTITVMLISKQTTTLKPETVE